MSVWASCMSAVTRRARARSPTLCILEYGGKASAHESGASFSHAASVSWGFIESTGQDDAGPLFVHELLGAVVIVDPYGSRGRG